MTSRFPPLLEPYLHFPSEAYFVLVTSVLGASSNWLVLRFLHSVFLVDDTAANTADDGARKVVFVSFMRDLSFWKENAKRIGLDFDRLIAEKKFAFVNGFSELFLPKQEPTTGEEMRGKQDFSCIFGNIREAIHNLAPDNGPSKVLLFIDQLDLLLAAGDNQLGAVELGEMLLEARESVHATVITLAADHPLISPLQTPLETRHASLLSSVAHQADLIMNLRLLDSGTARDVSGVIRITEGVQKDEKDHGSLKHFEEKELLYFVGGDGGVKVFERGQ